MTDNLDDNDEGVTNAADLLSGSKELEEKLQALQKERDEKFAAEQAKMKELAAIKVDKDDVEKLISLFEGKSNLQTFTKLKS